MENIFMFVILIMIVIKNISSNRDLLRKLSVVQIFGVGFSYVATVVLAGLVIYYGGNWLAGFFSNGIIKFIIQMTVIIVVLYTLVGILNRILAKITNGMLPKNGSTFEN